jgi:hypothetical protein
MKTTPPSQPSTRTLGRGARRSRSHLLLTTVFLAAFAALGDRPARAQEAPGEITVDGQVALRSLMALGDGHLQKTADVLTLVAATEAARSGRWNDIRSSLAMAAELTVPAVNWFALPDGTYWTLEGGREEASLADRPYFPRLLAGQHVLGDLVVSRATGRSTAIVAVPVREGSAVMGALGASIHLDSLSQLIEEEVGLGPNDLFFTLDREPLVGLHADPEIIFLQPLEEDDPELQRAILEIIGHEEGEVTYTFRGTRRTVLYRRSPVTGWWYAFGRIWN